MNEAEASSAGSLEVEETTAKEQHARARKKRLDFLDRLLKELDTVVILQFITIYYLDCSFFWFLVRVAIQLTLLTPLPDLAIARQHEENKPFLPLILFCFAGNFILHLAFPAPDAGEDTRRYLHGGLVIDFIGQMGPTSKLRLAALDVGVLLLQVMMLAVHVKRRELKKRSETSQENESGAQGEDSHPAPDEQDVDSEERGVLHRTNSISEANEGRLEQERGPDFLDSLFSGQAIIADLYPVTTLLREHENYQIHRRSTVDSGSSLSPTTLRQLRTIRARLGVGGS